MLCVSLDGSADQSADEPAKKRGSDLAPVIRVQCAAVTAVMVAIVMVMLRRLMAFHMRRRRWRVTSHIIPWSCVSWSVMRLRGHFCGCFCRVFGWSRNPERMRLLRRCVHRRRSLVLRWRIPFRSGHRRSTESAAHRERHHHLLYCLVHCRVPFVFSARPFSRLQKVRTLQWKFLTKFWN